jgi:hypothetical protein
MSIEATPVSIDMNDDLAKAVAAAKTPEDITALVKAEFDKQVAAATAEATQTATDAKAAADAEAAKVAAAAAAEAAKTATAVTTPTILSRVENIAGTDIEFTGASEAEIDKLVINALKIAAAVRPTTQAQTVDPTADAEAARVAAETKAAAAAELELRFKRGELSTSEYIEQSGAVKDYLEKQGIPLEALRASIEREQGQTYEQSWAKAGEEFKNTPLGRSWPGGERNKQMLGMKVAELGLTDAEDKVAALAAAYQAMISTNMLFPGEAEEKAAAARAAGTVTADPDSNAVAVAAAAAAKAASDAAAAAATAAANAKKSPTSSSIFGASSGVGGVTDGAAKTQGPQIAVPADATPEQLLAAWKAAQVEAGVHPDAAFQQLFAKK